MLSLTKKGALTGSLATQKLCPLQSIEGQSNALQAFSSLGVGAVASQTQSSPAGRAKIDTTGLRDVASVYLAARQSLDSMLLLGGQEIWLCT